MSSKPEVFKKVSLVQTLVKIAEEKLSAKLSKDEFVKFVDGAITFSIRNKSVNETLLFNWIYENMKNYLKQKAAENFRLKSEAFIKTPVDRIVYGETTRIHDLITRGYEPDFVSLKNLANVAIRKSILLLDSRFRNINADPTADKFTMKFNSALRTDPSKVFVAGTTLVGSELAKRIIKLEIIGITLPNIISPVSTDTDLPYILIDFPETAPNSVFTSVVRTPVVFGKIQIDRAKDSEVSFRRMTNSIYPYREWSTESPITLTQLTPTFYNPNGFPLNFGVDAFNTNAFDITDISYVTGIDYIVKSIQFTSATLIDTDMSGKEVTFYQLAVQMAYQDIGSPSVYYYTAANYNNAINGSTFIINKTGDYTFKIELNEPLITASTFPDDHTIAVNTYGIGKGSGGYAIINSRQVMIEVQMTALY